MGRPPARDIAEGDVAIERLLARHAEDALGDDIARHLERPSADRRDLADEEAGSCCQTHSVFAENRSALHIIPYQLYLVDNSPR